MKIKFKQNELINKDNFQDVLQKALKNIEEYELSNFEFEKEWTVAYLQYLEEVIDSVIKGLALKLNVNPLEVHKSFHIPILPLLKASNGDISGEALLLKSLWQKLKDKYTKSVNTFKKFFFNKGNPLKPMKIKGQIVYNPETKKDLTKGEWKDIEDSVIDYLGDTLNDPNEELAVKSGLFGLLRKKMDDQGKSIEEQKKVSYDDILDEYGYEINNPKEMYEKISKEKQMKASIDYAKKHGAEFLSIKDGEIKNKIISMMRKQIVGGLEDGIPAQEMISRLYWIDPSDELGKRFTNDTVQAWNRDLRRIVLTELSMATNNGYIAANQDAAQKGEKLYFVFSGAVNPQEGAGEPCNVWIGKIGLLMDTPQSSEDSEDSFADYLIWYGKNNVGRKQRDWWFSVPVHPWCRHYWQRIHPQFQKYDPDTDKIEYKEIEKSQDFSLDNIEWKTDKANFLKQKLPEYINKIKKELKINFPIIVRLYKQHPKDKLARSLHDEGIIILYENTPDWTGDLSHEVGHLYFHLMKVVNNEKIINKLKSIQRSLKRRKSFNRVFNNDHTYSNIKEIFATIFKWYLSGKMIDKSYLDILLEYLPGNDISFLNDLFIENLNKSIDLSPTIAFDFDKVIAEYNGRKGPVKFGKPIRSTIDLMQQYKDKGYKIIIFTARPDNKAIRKYLKDHKVYYDQFIGNKPFYNCFIDDRTVNNLIHKNDLKQTIDKVLSFDDDLKKSMKFDLIKNDQTKLKMNYKGI